MPRIYRVADTDRYLLPDLAHERTKGVHVMTTRIRLRRLGVHPDQDGIEPSCGLLDVIKDGAVTHRVIVDCGLVPRHDDSGELQVIPELSSLKDGRPVDLLLVTHAHWDHAGALPAIVPFLAPDAKVAMTTPTARLIRNMLEFELQDERAEDRPRPYAKAHAHELLRRFRIITKPGCHEMLSGLPVHVHPAGHIPGACAFTVNVAGRKIHWSGDRCEHDQPGVLGAEALPKIWQPDIIAGSDCTYGASPDSDRHDWHEESEKLANLARETLRQGRRMLIFAFSIHRGGAAAHELQRLDVTADGPVFLDGSARQLTSLLANNRYKWCGRDQPLRLSKIGMIADHSQRRSVARIPTGWCVIAPPGMGGPHGIGCWWRDQLVNDPDAVLAFTGFVAPGTDGAKLLAAAKERDSLGAKSVPISFTETDRDGHEYEVETALRCQVKQFRLGGHANRSDTVRWFRGIAPQVAVISHGSPAALESIESELSDMTGTRLVRADREPEVEIDI